MEKNYDIPTDEGMLEEALRLASDDRQKIYGNAYSNHVRIAKIWSVILGFPVSPDQVVMCMIGTKLARLVQSPNHRDSWVDIAGYVSVKDQMGPSE